MNNNFGTREETYMQENYDKIGEECGVFAIFNNNADYLNSARLTYYGLYALQHRGQESCGITVWNGNEMKTHKGMGLVHEVFDNGNISSLDGNVAIGHVRYSTTGSSKPENAQPIVVKYKKGSLAMAHNGNLVNASELRAKLESMGSIFQSTNDSEVLVQIIARERINSKNTQEAVLKAMDIIKGAYSIVVMTADKLIAARDKQGFRPLCIGKIDDSYVVASETCALDSVKATFLRDIEPGEIVVIDKNGVNSIKDNCGQKHSSCVFEYIYFARTDSIIDNVSVYKARKEAGRQLAKASPVDADMIIGVPDSGLVSAMGFAEESHIPYGDGLVKNRYIGRTFIQPDQKQREDSVNIKLNALRSEVEGKRIVMIDDSIVRGTTSAKLITMLKHAGARQVHMRISSPPFMWPCYFGTDIPSKDQLIACKHSIEEIRQLIGADSLAFLPIDALSKIVEGLGVNGYCDACFSGNYTVDIPKDTEKIKFDKPFLV